MGGQGFSKQRLLVALLECVYGSARESFRFTQTTLGQESSGASVINLSNCLNIFEFDEEMTSAIKMTVGFTVSSDLEEQVDHVVFDTCKVAIIPRLLEVKTSSSRFD